MIKNFEPRLYQQLICNTCIKKNTLVVLPTGLGKTNIFIMLAAQRLRQYPNTKILLIGPTRPLIDQYYETFLNFFEIEKEKLAIFTGKVTPEKREELWKNSTIIFSTPQGLENDIITKRIDLREVSLLGFDEAHRATGNYAYVFIAKQYVKLGRFPRIVALTASPGSDIEKIAEVSQNLFIEDIEVRTDSDPDVKEYIKDIDLRWIKVDLNPEFQKVQKFISDFIEDRINMLKALNLIKKPISFNKTDLLKMQAELRGIAASGEKDYSAWKGISILAEIMKVQHALELLETQGIHALHSYLEKMEKDGIKAKTKAIANIVKDHHFRSALIRTRELYEQKYQHPKLIELIKIIDKKTSEDKNIKIIIFNQYRDNATDIVEQLNNLSDAKASLFVGQQKKGETGLSQKKQKELLDEFKLGNFNVLVATSVAEEGLDIPSVDLVIFYEPIPSAIRHIQRRGRTGRQEKGEVIILMTKGTRDEGYRWSAHHKEKRMHRTLGDLKQKMQKIIGVKKDVPLENFIQEKGKKKIKIYADHREKGSAVIKSLLEHDIELKLEQLSSADYVLSNRVGIEYKTSNDFINSIIDGRLLDQLKSLKKNFERPMMIIEGDDLYSIRNIHHNAIRGMLATIAVSYNIPILFTKNSKESASFLYIIAKREQEDSKDFSLHAEKRTMSIRDMQEYIVSALPGVGATLAKPLLRRFKSVKNIINASKEELEQVEKIGPKTAEKIKDILEREYQEL